MRNKFLLTALVVALGIVALVIFTTADAKGPPFGKGPKAEPSLLLTFKSGDVIAEPQMMEGRDSKRGIKLAGGPITATIDFVKLEPNVCTGSAEWLHYMQAKNPITYSKLSVQVTKDVSPTRSLWLDWEVTIDGTKYQVVMNAFLSFTMDSSPTEYTIRASEGRFAIQSGREMLVVSRGVDLVFSVSK
ncbi:MAG: hypothetical protein ABIL62_01205 [Planctomycetota bacterium]